MIENKYFETVVLALILLSSFVMTLEDVWFTTKPMLMDVLYYLDKILTVVFFLETCLKLVAMGLVAYFGNAWCWLDFIIVGVSIVNFGASVIGEEIKISSLAHTFTIKNVFSRFWIIISFQSFQGSGIFPSSKP